MMFNHRPKKYGGGKILNRIERAAQKGRDQNPSKSRAQVISCPYINFKIEANLENLERSLNSIAS